MLKYRCVAPLNPCSRHSITNLDYISLRLLIKFPKKFWSQGAAAGKFQTQMGWQEYRQRVGENKVWDRTRAEVIQMPSV